MKLKLKENPREWSKFATVMMVLVSAVSLLLWKRAWMERETLICVAGGCVLVALAAWVFPRPFRALYRGGMTASFHVGRVMGAVLLTVFFLALVTPLGLGLRLAGKDLLGLKRRRGVESYWRKARTGVDFDRQF